MLKALADAGVPRADAVSVVVVTDSSARLPAQSCAEWGIRVVPCTFWSTAATCATVLTRCRRTSTSVRRSAPPVPDPPS